jgi:L-aminopeptidase/D-esterase-like protein
VRGGAPGTRESAALDPANLVPAIHALLLTGGSAFGLDAAGGVMRWLEERGAGFPTPAGPVPIVPGAVIYDLRLGGRRPDASTGYAAAAAARDGRESGEGNVGAGLGATVGKARGADGLMKGGLGLASARIAGGFRVGAVAVVNAWGDVVDEAEGGAVVAGCRAEGGGFVNTVEALQRGELARPVEPAARASASTSPSPSPSPGASAVESTTLVAIVTDAPLGKLGLTRVARMGHDGMARAVRPVHTPWDGDVVYAISTAEREEAIDPTAAGAVGAEVVAAAIVRGVRMARSVPGAPAAQEVRG